MEMTSVGAFVLLVFSILFISICAISIGKKAPQLCLAFFPLLIAFVLPCTIPHMTFVKEITPINIEKTSFNLVVSHPESGTLMSENISVYNAETNSIVILKYIQYNMFGKKLSCPNKCEIAIRGLHNEKVIDTEE